MGGETAPVETSTLLDGEQRIAVGDLEIAYQTFGDASAVPLLLVMGLGTQMLGWPEDLCQDLADQGHYVIRYDNRDIGCSTHLDHLRAPRLRQMQGYATRRQEPPYTIDDMAGDALGLLDALQLGRTHLVGVSLGGFIAQTAALRDQSRFRSLTLIMTSTGSRRVGQPRPGLALAMARRPAVTSKEEAVQATLAAYADIGSPGFPLDEPYLRAKSAMAYDRSHDGAGYLRQLAASVAQPNRTEALAGLDLPTLVIHGLRDPLVRKSGGLALARIIPGAKFVGYNGMGHDLPRALWPDIGREIGALATRADDATSPSSPEPAPGGAEVPAGATADA